MKIQHHLKKWVNEYKWANEWGNNEKLASNKKWVNEWGNNEKLVSNKKLVIPINRVNNQAGIALVTVLMIFVVTTIIGLSLLGLSASNLQMSSVERNYQSTYYIAESGTTKLMNEVNANVIDVYHSAINETEFFTNVEQKLDLGLEKTYDAFEDFFGEKPVAKMKIERVSSHSPTRKYKITSQGLIGKRSRMVEKQFSITWNPKNNRVIPTDTAVFVNQTINLSGGAMIAGAVGTNSSANSSITLTGGTSISGDIFVGPNAGNNVISKPDYIVVGKPIKLASPKIFQLPPFPSFPNYPIAANAKVSSGKNSYDVILNGALRVNHWLTDDYTLKLNRNTTFTEITVNQGNHLTIDIGAENRRIVVNNLNVLNGNIRIVGTGKLTIYLKGNIAMGSGSVINSGGNIDRLELYLKGSGVPTNPKTLALSGAQKIYGSLFAEDATLSFSGGSGFQGHLITGGKTFTIDGGAYTSSNLIYAPNAVFDLSGGATVKGSIVAKSLTADGGSRVTFMPLDEAGIPFFPETGGSVTEKDIISSEPVRERES